MANSTISFDDLIKGVFQKSTTEQPLFNIRFVEVVGTGSPYPSCGKLESKEVIFKKLIGQDVNGCPAIRYVAKTETTCDAVSGCGERLRNLNELLIGSIELGADGLPAVRIQL